MLNEAGIRAQLLLIQQDLIPHAQLGLRLACKDFSKIANVDRGEGGRVLGLALEQVSDSRDGIKLELLVGVEMQFHLYRLEHDLFILENLHGIGLELIVACKPQIETDDALRFHLCHGADGFEREFFFETDHHAAAGYTVNRLVRQFDFLDWRSECEAALEQDFIQNILARAPCTDMLDVQFKLLFKRHPILRRRRIPCFEIGLCQFEDAEAAILLVIGKW